VVAQRLQSVETSPALVDKIIVAPHPHKIIDGRRHYTIRASHTSTKAATKAMTRSHQ